MKKMFKFLQNERGDVFIWVAFLVGLFVFGLVILFFEDVMQPMFGIGDIPNEQLTIERSAWRAFALIGALALALWAMMEGQRRR